MRRAIPFAVLAIAAAASSVRAQTTCVTPNCVFGDAPPACKNTAAAMIPTVLLTISGGFVFVPAQPRIEPGGCILWQGTGVTHSATGDPCPSTTLCNSPAPASCNFESGNLGAQVATCRYDPAQFPSESGTNYYCRFHATPTSGTMRGTVRVTTPIVLTVGKNVGTSSVELSWAGGGVPGDVSYKVARQNAGDPRFPAATTTTVNPNGGVLGTTFTDAGELGSPTTRFYLVRNKQTNEP
jgi:plastocyanin